MAPTRSDQADSLDETLHLSRRVVHAAVTSIVVSDPHLPGNPIVYHNPAFETLSGYRANEIDGRNCRFLQGADSDPEAIAEIRRAIADKKPCHVLIQNYRKDGTPFWNDLVISPVSDATRVLSHSARHDEILGYVGLEPSLQWGYTCLLSHVHPDDHARVDALYNCALATGTGWQFECRIFRASDGVMR